MKPLTVFAKARREGRSFVGGGGKPAGAVARVFYGAATPLSRTCEPAATGASRLQRKRCLPGPVLPGSHRWLIAVLAAAILLGRSLAAGADPPAPPPAPAAAGSTAGFAAFRSIGDWNIFDSSRVGRTINEPAPPAGDTISLVGTMQYAKGLLAFFDSPDANYRKTLRVGEAIARFTVVRIMADGVELAQDAKQLSLTVGQQLHRPEGGDWTVTGASRVERVPAANGAPAIPADASDVLRRLMEQRQKQLKQ